MKTYNYQIELQIPESKEECEEIACVDCLYRYEEPWKCFENRGETDEQT